MTIFGQNPNNLKPVGIPTAQRVDCPDLQRAFLEFPYSLYHDCPYWVPPTDSYGSQLAGFEPHPFYDHAECQAFLAIRDGEVCGRIAAIINHSHNEWHQKRYGFFGFFESIDDQEVANVLFDSVVEWLCQNDCSIIRGPANPAITYQGGLLVDHFDLMPTFLMSYNPRYYIALLEQYGFQSAQNIHSFTGSLDMLDVINPKIAVTANMAMERFGVNIRNFDMTKLDEELALFYDIYNQSLNDMWGYTPVTDSEIRYAGKTWGDMIDPDFTSIAEVDGNPIAVSIGLLDYNQLFAATKGNFSWNELSDVSAISRLQIPYTLVLPKYRYWGLGPAILSSMVEKGLNRGITEVEFSWIAESNQLSIESLRNGGAKPRQTHRIYDLPISAQ